MANRAKKTNNQNKLKQRRANREAWKNRFKK